MPDAQSVRDRATAAEPPAPTDCVHVDDPGGELPAAFHMPAEAPIEALRADPVTAAQHAVLADAALFGLLGRKLVLGDRHEGGVVEPVDRRRHVAIDVGPFGDELAFVLLTGECQEHAAFNHAEIAGADERAVSRGQRMAQSGDQHVDRLAPATQPLGVASLASAAESSAAGSIARTIARWRRRGTAEGRDQPRIAPFPLSTKRAATSRRNSFSLSNASRRMPSALSQ